MIRRDRVHARAAGSRVPTLLLSLALLLGSASPAQAEDCSDYPGGVLDGFAGTIAPSQLSIDRNCTIRNYPGGMSTNFSFFTQPGQQDERWLVIFDNVVHTGQMSCNAVHGHRIWFVNGSSSRIKEHCQNLLIPVEKIDKQNPAGQTTAAIGVPFTYRLVIPVLFDPATGTVIDYEGSPNDLHGITVWDDLDETGVDLTYLGHTAYWLGSGAPVPHTFSNAGGALTFDLFPIVPAGDQFVIEITVVLEDTPTNAVGTQFVNTAKWDFGRLIDGVFYEPLPGEWGISPPLTIAAPVLVMTKTGPATLGRTLNLGEWGQFTLDVQNTGLGDAWEVTILDRLPDGPTGGTCEQTPEVQGVTLAGSALTQGTHYSLGHAGPPTCELSLTLLGAAGPIGPGEHLIVDYRTRLDADSQDGATLTNVAGATEWFNGDSGNPSRLAFTRSLSDGTVGVLDHEDAHTVTVALHGYFFEKTVANLTTGANPTATAAAGDTLRYTLRLQSTDVPLDALGFTDDLGALNASPVFVPGSLTLVASPPGADTTNTNPSGGTNGSGVLDVRGLDVPANAQILVVFDVALDPTLADGTVVLNQSDLISGGVGIAESDDPNVNGQADPDVAGDEDPTRVVIATVPPAPVLKANTQGTAAVGEAFRYRITVPETPYAYPIHDLRILDDLTDSAADLRFVGVTKVSGSGPWTPINTGTDTQLVIEDPTLGIDVPAGEQVVVEITVVLEDTPTNAAGLTFTNTADYTYNRIDENAASQRPGAPGTTAPMTIVEPALTLEKSGPATMTIGTPETFTLDVQNAGAGPAWNATLSDLLPSTPTGGTCDAAPTAVSAQVFAADGTTPVSGVLVEGTHYALTWSGAPGCLLTLRILGAQGTIGPGQRLIVRYEAQLDAATQNGVSLTNVAGAVEWFSFDGASTERRTYTEVVTDGTVGLLDHEDAHSVAVALPDTLFEKTVMNVTSGANPATTAAPGDVLRYTLRLGNASDVPLADLAFLDDLGRLNATPVFEPGTLSLTSVPPGADASATDPTGGTHGTGRIDVRNLSLPGAGQIAIEFEITLASPLADGTLVINQSQLLSGGVLFAQSDDPNQNGQADPFVSGDEDPTRVQIEVPPANALQKQNTQTTAAIGVPFRYRIAVPATPHAFPLYDVRILDDLTASAADLRFLGVTKVSGSGSWTPVNTGTDTLLVIEDPAIGIDVPAGEQAVVEITVVLEDTPTNAADLAFTNTGDYTYNWTDEDDASRLPGAPGTTAPMTIVEPALTLEKSGPAQMTVGTPGTFTLDVHNPGGAPAWNLTITDRLPDGATGGSCDAAPSQVAAQLLDAGGAVLTSLVAGTDFAVGWSGAPACTLTLGILSAAGTVGPGQRLRVTYQTELDADTQNGVTLTNVAGATGWFSADASSTFRRSYTRALTDGTVGVLDHEDAHSVAALANAPVLFAAKSVALLQDAGTPNAVDPGDVLRYTVTVTNSGGVPATGATLNDGVPANTTYVPDSVTLNGVPVGQPDLGIFPLLAGIPISSADLTPPLPGPGAGTLTAGQTAVVHFDLRVDAGVPGGTVISNQAVVGSAELPDLPTDGDGDPGTGPEPTVVVVSNGQQLLITKAVAVVGGGAALPGSTLEYVVSVVNVSLVPATGVLVTDDLDAGTPGQLAYVAQSATLNGSTNGVSFAGSILTADYSGLLGPLPPGASIVLRFRAVVDPGLALGTTVTNIGVVTWNTPLQTASASVSIDLGGMPGVGALNGTVWHDADFDDALGLAERVLEGWIVELLRNGQPTRSATTDASGSYRIVGIAPNATDGAAYELRFRAPDAGPNTAALGIASSVFTNAPQRIADIAVTPGSNLQDLDLPIDPNGVVYAALQRTPIAGATLTLLAASGGTALPATCFDDPVQQGQVTGSRGYYKFDLNFSDTACPAGASYLIAVAPPGAGFTPGASQIIPPLSDASTSPFSVPACPGSAADAVPFTAAYCEVQASELAPPTSVPPGAGTGYHVHLSLDASQVPGSSQIFNNHIPVDPVLDGAVAISKTTPSLNVSRGQLVPYEITLGNELGAELPELGIVDRFPAGFRYVEGSARVDGVPLEPAIDGQQLVWSNLGVGASGRRSLRLLLAVGAGVSDGEYVNRAQAVSSASGAPLSGEASATVRVVPDPTFACTDVIGKVFDDADRDGVQDAGERGLAGVRLVTARGLVATTDAHGRYHITCAATPNEARGSNFVLKLDDRTLPSGYRMSSRPVQVQRASYGKALRLNYAASVHRVVGLDLADGVFEPGSTEMRPQWKPRIALLLDELEKAPATLRLSYVADVEDEGLVERRLAAVRKEIARAWKALHCCYALTIEREVFWSRGAPAPRPTVRRRDGR